MRRRFDQRTLAVLTAESGAIPLMVIAGLTPDFVRGRWALWVLLAIGAYTVVSITVTVLAGPLNDAQFAALSFGGMLGVAGSAWLLTDDGAAHAVLALLAVVPAIAAMGSPPRTVVTFVAAAVLLACLVVMNRGTSVASLVVGGGAVIMAITVPTYLVTTLRRSLERSLARQARLSETDPLTQILNRRGLAAHWPAIVRKAAETGQAIGFLEADVDHFKDINDRLGHSEGDDVLVEVAGALVAAGPSHALVARTGGEEFVIVDLVADERRVRALSEDLRRGVAESCAATISIGAVHATVVPIPRRSPIPTQTMLDDLLAVADRRLYEAKRTGRNRITVTSVEIAAAADDAGAITERTP